MKPYLHSAGSTFHILWNVDCAVGKGGQNSVLADVSYVQWYYSLAANNPLTPQDRKAIYRNVGVTGRCSGIDADPLVAAIKAHQQALGHPQIDGRISVATGSGKIGASAFFVLRLGARFADMFPAQWPRLDLIPGCPPSVMSEVRATIPKIS